MGLVLPRPFGWSGLLDKIFKNILDHSLLDAKVIVEKYSFVLTHIRKSVFSLLYCIVFVVYYQFVCGEV